MEVNNLLCVGRARLSQFGKTKLSSSGLRSTEVLEEVNSETGITEIERIARMSSKSSSGSSSPPTRSILRGRVLSPKQSSPSSLRNVRFSDKDSDDESLYAKIHVNKNIQTEMTKDLKNEKKREGTYHGLKLHFTETNEEPKQSGAHEIKTSTPRYSKVEETPSLDFHTPRGREEKSKTLQKPVRADKCQSSQGCGFGTITQSQQIPDPERIIIDIDIEHKKPRDASTYVSEYKLLDSHQQKGGRMSANSRPDGNQIIQNMDFKVNATSNSPQNLQPCHPDGHRIVQNMELNSSNSGRKFRSTASQTSDSSASSPRSASPETPSNMRNVPDGSDIIKNMDLGLKMKSEAVQTVEIPDGNRIIQNLELDARNCSKVSKSDTVQTSKKPDGKKIIQNIELSSIQTNSKNKSVKVQTVDPEDVGQHLRSVPVQTEMTDSEMTSAHDNFNDSGSRSVGIQATEPTGAIIPDGSQIIRNMDIHKSEKHKSYCGSIDDKRCLNDGNWNEFVRHLELFNPSSSSSSSISEDEPPPTPTSEPVLVYDRNAPSPQTVSQSTQRLSERSARTFLESEAFKMEQYESVLREGGLLSKLESGLKSSPYSSVNAKSAVDKVSGSTDKSLSKTVTDVVNTNSRPCMHINKTTDAQFRMGNSPDRIETGKSSFSKINSKVKIQSKVQADKICRKPEKESLGFTPIETYSFNPGTLIKTAPNKALSPPNQSVAKTLSGASMDRISSSPVRESVSKNSFVQGLDLGPLPNDLSTQPRSTMIESDLRSYVSYKRDMNEPRQKTVSTTRYSSSEKELTRSGNRSTGSFSRSYLNDKTPLDSYDSIPCSYATGPSYKPSVPMYQSTRKPDNFQSRPSSAPVYKGKQLPSSSTLTASLKEMRSSVVRKNAMGLYSDQRKISTTDADKLWSKTTTPYTYRSNNHTEKQPTLSEADGFTRSVSSYTSSKISSEASNYLHALNDRSNKRPRSRSRSRSRSPIPSARSAYDKRYAEIKQSSGSYTKGLSAYKDFDKRFFNNYDENRGNFESGTSSGLHAKSEVMAARGTSSKDTFERNTHSIKRESRSLTRKPPLPFKTTSARSRSSNRNHEEATNIIKGETAKQKHPVSGNEGLIPSPVLREKLSRPEVLDTRKDDRPSHGPEKVSIGVIPCGIVDPGCMFLGHDTIQKIIDEAKL